MEICGVIIKIFNHSTFCVRDKGHLGQHSDSNVVWEHGADNERSNRDNARPVSSDDDADNRAQ